MPRDDRFVPIEPPPLPLTSAVKGWLPQREEKLVAQAIRRGINHLKTSQFADGSWRSNGRHQRYVVGTTALPALALLECGVPATDPCIRRAAAFIRKHVKDLTQTYEISLCILFLDRLRAPEDRGRIVTLSIRLLAGQYSDGGWSYFCPILTAKEELSLLIALRNTRPQTTQDLFVRTSGDPLLELYTPKETSTSLQMALEEQNPVPTAEFQKIALAGVMSKPLPADANNPGGPEPPDNEGDIPGKNHAPKPKDRGNDPEIPAAMRQAIKQLPERLREIPALWPPEVAHKARLQFMSTLLPPRTPDNSNTQFAILGLWAARRYQVPVDRALALIVWRFYSSQNDDGSWSYRSSPFMMDASDRPSMSGAALIGLGVGYGLTIPNGAARDKGIPQNPKLIKGIRALGQTLGERGRNELRFDLYYWWTVERVAVLYGLRSFQGQPWYEHGVNHLLPAQRPDGGWISKWSRGSTTPATSFALMFLKGCNLVSDLSDTIRGPARKPG